MTAKLFEAALGIASPWYINGVAFDAAKKTLSIAVDFVAGSRFSRRKNQSIFILTHSCPVKTRTDSIGC